MSAPSSIRPGQPGTPAPSPAWHALSSDTVLASLCSSQLGLSDLEARARQARYGLNRLPVASGVSALEILGNQLRSVVVLLLVAAGALSLAIGDLIEAVAIAVVLVINAGLGFTTDWRARQAMAALLRLEAPRALVFRDARLRAIAAEHLVPGDVVQLDAGNKVPADVRLIEAADLSIDEAPLTGESLAVEKTVGPIDAATLVADRRNMAYMGTTAVSGTGLAVVTGTGAQTELGRARTPSRRPRPAPGLVNHRDRRPRLGGGARARRAVASGIADRDRPGCRRHARGAASCGHDGPCRRHAPDGTPSCARATVAIGRVSRFRDRRLH